MAKIRTLKSEFFRNANISRAGRTAKLLAAGLVLTVADDEGRFRAAPDQIRGEVFTHDEVTTDEVQAALGALADESVDFIRLYTVNNRPYGCMPGWKEHQRVPPSRFVKSKLPAPPNTKKRRQLSAESQASDIDSQATRSSRAGVGMEGRGRERKGRDTPIGSPVGETDALVLATQVSLSPVEQVFDAWRQRWHPTAKLTDERRGKIQGRLKDGWSVDDLVMAVTEGVANDPWADRHVGLNDDVKNLLRNESTVEKFLELSRTPLSHRMPASTSRAAQLDRLYAEAQNNAREEGR